MKWTDPATAAKLRELWASGLSASQIAARFGGTTRNAVIGAVHRADLPKRITTSRARSPRRHYQNVETTWRKPAKPKAPRQPPKDRGFEFAPLPDAEVKTFVLAIHPEDAGINRRPLAELNGHDCRWPIGDPRHDDFGFCGGEALTGRSYCAAHASRAYRAPEG